MKAGPLAEKAFKAGPLQTLSAFAPLLVMTCWLMPLGVSWAKSTQDPVQETWPSLIQAHLERYPEARAQDLYKLVYQATLGPEHAVPSYESAWERIQREWEGLPSEETGLLWEALRPDGKLGRLNLKALKAHGGSPEALAQCFLQSAQSFQKDQDTFFEVLQLVLEKRPGPSRAVREFRWFLRKMSRQKYPAVHHSDAFRQNYQPAYRVVKAECLKALGIQILASEEQ